MTIFPGVGQPAPGPFLRKRTMEIILVVLMAIVVTTPPTTEE